MKRGLTITLGIIVLLSAMSWIPYLLGILVCGYIMGKTCVEVDFMMGWMYGLLVEIICTFSVATFVALCYCMYICCKGIYVYIRGVFIGLDQSMQIAEKEASSDLSEIMPLNLAYKDQDTINHYAS